jgi:hypothetical protein
MIKNIGSKTTSRGKAIMKAAKAPKETKTPMSSKWEGLEPIITKDFKFEDGDVPKYNKSQTYKF